MDKLENKICSDIEIYLDYIGIDRYNKKYNNVAMACPIHDGDNTGAFVIFLDGVKRCGNFKCFTRNCYLEDNNVIHLAAHLKQQTIDKTKEELSTLYKNVTGKEIEYKSRNKLFINQDEYLRDIKIPSEYYLDRGFSKFVLNKFQIGFCSDPNNPMYMRSTAPVYDNKQEKIIGIVGRSIFEKCEDCGAYHNPKTKCPEGFRVNIYSKWKNSAGFFTAEELYNSWNIKTDHVCVVEGQSDVWRAYEAGFRNVVGIFGMCIKPQQHALLKKLGVKKLTIILDNDEAGEKGKEIFLKNYSEHYQYKFLNPKGHDLSDMTVNEVRKFLI